MPAGSSAAQELDYVLDCFITAFSARDDCGIALSGDAFAIEAAAAEAMRRELAGMERGICHRHVLFDEIEAPLTMRTR